MTEEDVSTQLRRQREFDLAQIRKQLGDRLRTDAELLQRVVEELVLAAHDHLSLHMRSPAQCIRTNHALHALFEPLGIRVRPLVVHAASRIPETGDERGWQVGDTVDWSDGIGYSKGDPSVRTYAIGKPDASLATNNGMYRAHLVSTVEAPPGLTFANGMQHLLIDSTVDQFNMPIFGINLPSVLVTPFDLEGFLANGLEKQRRQHLTVVFGDGGGYVGYVPVVGGEVPPPDDNETLQYSAGIVRLARLRMSARGLIEAPDLYPDYADKLSFFGKQHKELADEDRAYVLDKSGIALDDELRKGIDDMRRLFVAAQFGDFDETDAFAGEVSLRYSTEHLLRMATAASCAEGGRLSSPQRQEGWNLAFAEENRDLAKVALASAFADFVERSPAFAAAALVVPNGLRYARAARSAITAAEGQRGGALLPYIDAVADEVRFDPDLYRPGGPAERRMQRRTGTVPSLPPYSFLEPIWSGPRRPSGISDEQVLGVVLDLLEEQGMHQLVVPLLRVRHHLQSGDKKDVQAAMAELHRPMVRSSIAAAAATDPRIDVELGKIPIFAAHVAMEALSSGQRVTPFAGRALLNEMRHPISGPSVVAIMGNVAAVSNRVGRDMSGAVRTMVVEAGRIDALYSGPTRSLWHQRPLVPQTPTSLFQSVDTECPHTESQHRLGLRYWASIETDREWREFHDRVDATLAAEFAALPPEERTQAQAHLRASLVERFGDGVSRLATQSLAVGGRRPDDPPRLALPPSGPTTPLPQSGTVSAPGATSAAVEIRGSDSPPVAGPGGSSPPSGAPQTPAGRGSRRATAATRAGQLAPVVRRRGSSAAVPSSAAGVRGAGRRRASGAVPTGQPAVAPVTTAESRRQAQLLESPRQSRSATGSPPVSTSNPRAPGRPIVPMRVRRPAVDSRRTPSSTPQGRISGRPPSDGRRQPPALGRPTPTPTPGPPSGTAGPG